MSNMINSKKLFYFIFLINNTILILLSTQRVIIFYCIFSKKYWIMDKYSYISNAHVDYIDELYKDYKKAGTLLLPYTIIRNSEGQEFNLKMSEIKLNEGVTEGDFN